MIFPVFVWFWFDPNDEAVPIFHVFVGLSSMLHRAFSLAPAEQSIAQSQSNRIRTCAATN